MTLEECINKNHHFWMLKIIGYNTEKDEIITECSSCERREKWKRIL